MSLDLARTVADAVLYEGYLLYPYRASARKNRVRWQFGVLGPPGAAADGVGEEPSMTAQCLVRGGPGAEVRVHLRFLQLQRRALERAEAGAPGRFVAVDELVVRGERQLSWDEAVEREVSWPAFGRAELDSGVRRTVAVPGGADIEPLTDGDTEVGRVVRRRWPLSAQLSVDAVELDGLVRLSVTVTNTAAERATNQDDGIRGSLIGAHLLLEVTGGEFVSLIDPPPDAVAAVARCSQHRCWPVLAGPAGRSDVVLASPIILYDHPEVAAESTGALFDSTEIDEILTLRVLTLTDEEKAEARATDPRAREIIDRCEAMTPEELQQLHGILRDPYATAGVHTSAGGRPDGDVPWWDPATDASFEPASDAVLVQGVPVRKGSRVRLHPSRRADAQDMFFAEQLATVTAVVSDVDGETHVAVVLADDPAADLHDWYGRYLYFAPDEVEPVPEDLLE